jgi:hypothetical protein
MTETRTETFCDGCRQTDDHPKTNIWGTHDVGDGRLAINPSLHFDCVPDALIEQFGLTADAPQHAVTVSAIEAAKGGTHGDDLLAHIQSLPSDNDYEPETYDAEEAVTA